MRALFLPIIFVLSACSHDIAPTVTDQEEPSLKLVYAPLPPAEDTSTSRDIYLQGEIDDAMAEAISKQLVDLDRSYLGKEIVLHITSYGGSVVSGLQIYDTMKEIHSPVRTICEMYCMSMAAILLASGDVRESQPDAQIMVHGISLNGVTGKMDEVLQSYQRAVKMQWRMWEILMLKTGKSLPEIEQMAAYDHFMTPADAIENKLIDAVIPTR